MTRFKLFALAAAATAAPALGQFVPTAQDRRVFAHAQANETCPPSCPPLSVSQTDEFIAPGFDPFNETALATAALAGGLVCAHGKATQNSSIAPNLLTMSGAVEAGASGNLLYPAVAEATFTFSVDFDAPAHFRAFMGGMLSANSALAGAKASLVRTSPGGPQTIVEAQVGHSGPPQANIIMIKNLAAGSYRLSVEADAAEAQSLSFVCGASPSNGASIQNVFLSGSCYADCDNSGTLSVADFTCFQNRFVIGSSYADCDSSGTHTVADFTCFQGAFAAGCP